MTGLWKADTMDVKRGVATSCDLVALPGKCAVSRYGIPTLKSLKSDTSRRASARKGQRRELLNPGSAGSVIRDREIGGVNRVSLPLRAPETPHTGRLYRGTAPAAGKAPGDGGLIIPSPRQAREPKARADPAGLRSRARASR